jgi:hypothetical protein
MVEPPGAGAVPVASPADNPEEHVRDWSLVAASAAGLSLERPAGAPTRRSAPLRVAIAAALCMMLGPAAILAPGLLARESGMPGWLVAAYASGIHHYYYFGGAGRYGAPALAFRL